VLLSHVLYLSLTTGAAMCCLLSSAQVVVADRSYDGELAVLQEKVVQEVILLNYPHVIDSAVLTPSTRLPACYRW